MPRNFFHAQDLGGEYLDLEQDFRLGTPTAVFGVSAPHKALIAAACAPGRIVYVADNAQSAAKAAEEIAGFSGEEPALLCAKDEVLLYKEAVSRDALFRRLHALYRVQRGARITVCDVESLLQLFPRTVRSLTLREGEEVDFDSLPAQLVALGYVRAASVDGKGNFALRGDILDIFPINEENPVRVDFFGDTVEKIKPYHFVTGERLEMRPSLDIVAATDVVVLPEEVPHLKDALFGELSSFRETASYERAQSIAGVR